MGGKARLAAVPIELRGGVWPMDAHQEVQASISDGFGRDKRRGRGHLGADLMFRRPHKGQEMRPEFTRWYYCHSNATSALACLPGKVVRYVPSKAKGGAVYISHSHNGSPRGYLSVCRHLVLDSVRVAQGDLVVLGQPLGLVGHAPDAGDQGINHLHFELWRPAPTGKIWVRAARAFDPEPVMRLWARP